MKLWIWAIFLCASLSAGDDKVLFSSDASEAASNSLPPLHEVQPLWHSHYAQAQQIAKETHKPLLLAFLGSSWCPWSVKLQKEVLADPSFCKRVADDFVLVSISVDHELDESNPLVKKFSVQQSPSLLILSPEEEEICKVSYLPLTADRFADHLREIAADFAKIKNAMIGKGKKIGDQLLVDLYTTAQKQGFKQFEIDLLEKGLRESKGNFFMLEKYATLLSARKRKKHEIRSLRAKIIETDPKNLNGTLLRVAIIDFNSMVRKLKSFNNPASAIAPLENYVNKFGREDKENLWKVQMMMAQFLFSKKLTKLALEHAQLSHEAAPENMKTEIAQVISYLQTFQ